jgi:hypothetical protein
MTIVLGWVFQVRQVVWRRVASPSRRIMMHAVWASSPNWADPRRMAWWNAGSRLSRAWPIAAAWTPMAAAVTERACWSRFRRRSSAEWLALTGFNCPKSLASAWCFFSAAGKMMHWLRFGQPWNNSTSRFWAGGRCRPILRSSDHARAIPCLWCGNVLWRLALGLRT